MNCSSCAIKSPLMLSADYLKEEIATLQHLLFGNKKAK